MRTTCPSCSAIFSVKPELVGRRVRCPKCKEAISVPAGEPTAAREDAESGTTGSSNWLTLGALLLISLAAVAAGGIVFGHQKGKSTSAQEVAEAQARASKAEHALAEREAELGRVKSDQAKESERLQMKLAALQKSEQAAMKEVERLRQVERQQAAARREQDEKVEAAKREQAAAKERELEAAKREQEAAKKRELATPKDGTQDFARIKDFYEKHIGQHYFIEGRFYRDGLNRDRERKCYSVRFANNKGAVDGSPSRDRLSFVASEAMGEKLLDLRGGSYEAILYVVIRYLDEENKTYPVGYITKIEFTELDLDVVKKYVAITITEDGKGVAHPNPYKKN